MKTAAIIDIGSTSVGGALFAQDRRADPSKLCSQVVFSSRNEITFQENADLPRFLAGIESVLQKTLADLVAAAPSQERPDQIFCFLSSPFYAAQTRLIKMHRSQPFTVSRQLIDQLLVDERERFKKEQPHWFALPKAAGEHQLLESKIMQIKLNGYVLRRPYGNRPVLLELASYLSITAREMVGRFRQKLQAAWPHRSAEFHSFMYAFFQVINEALGGKQNYLLLDIGGETTELSLIWRGLLWENISFPLGRNMVVRHLAKKLGVSSGEAYTALKLYLGGEHHPRQSDKIGLLLTEGREEWLRTFRVSLKQILELCFLADNMFMVGDPYLLPLFREWVEGSDFSDLTVGNKPLAVNILKEDLLSQFCDYETQISRDMSLMIEVMFCDKLIK